MLTQLADEQEDQRNPLDDEKYDAIDPFKFFRIDDDNPGTRDLASSELLSVLPGQQYSFRNKSLRLDFQNDVAQEQLSIILAVDASPGCGGIVWPAAQILSSYLIKRGTDFLRGKKVLELGSGTGLVGLVASKLCADRVWITDQKPLLEIMQHNISLNGLSTTCTVAELDWGASIPDTIPLPDVVLAADCVYFEPAFPLLVQTLDALVRNKTEVLFCYKKRRKADKRFFGMLRKKFTWTEVMDDPNRTVYAREAISLIRLERRV